jgi:hypothetical protein
VAHSIKHPDSVSLPLYPDASPENTADTDLAIVMDKDVGLK